MTTAKIVTFTYSTSLSNLSPIFTQADRYGDYFYIAVRVTSATSGTYTFHSSSSIDTIGYLYNNSFTPSSPKTNLIVADDESGGNGQFSLTATLVSKATVILVVTTFFSGVTGKYQCHCEWTTDCDVCDAAESTNGKHATNINNHNNYNKNSDIRIFGIFIQPQPNIHPSQQLR